MFKNKIWNIVIICLLFGLAIGSYFIKGPKGDHGEKGEQGIQGVQGEQGLPGKDGQDGYTPNITIGENGNWFIDGVDTKVAAQGEKGEQGVQGQPGTAGQNGQDGHTPVISIGQNGNWIIDGVDTGVSSLGQKGDKGEQGVQGQPGQNGTNGKSAYEIYKEQNPGYNKTEEEWINDLTNGLLEQECVITFDTDGGSTVSSITLKYGSTLTKPIDPTKKGFVFDGWYLEEELLKEDLSCMVEWQFSYFTVSKDITLKAKWIKDDNQYFKQYMSEDEWYNLFELKNVSVLVSVDEDGVVVNDVEGRIINNHLFVNYIGWDCFYYYLGSSGFYTYFYDNFNYNGEYCYGSIFTDDVETYVKIYINDNKQITKIECTEYNWMYSGIVIASIDFIDYDNSSIPDGIVFSTYEDSAIIDGVLYNLTICSNCDEVISMNKEQEEELDSIPFSDYITKNEWYNALNHQNYTLEAILQEGSYYDRSVCKIIDNNLYRSYDNDDSMECSEIMWNYNFTRLIYELMYDKMDVEYNIAQIYSSAMYNGKYAYAFFKEGNYEVIIKIYFNEDKLIEKVVADVLNIYYPNIDIVATFNFYDYNTTVAPTNIVHNYLTYERNYENNLSAKLSCRWCGEEKTIELNEELSNYIKLLYQSTYWEYYSYTSTDGILVEEYYNYYDNYMYSVQSKDGVILSEYIANNEEQLTYDYETQSFMYDYYGNLDLFNLQWIKYVSCLYNNFEKFELSEADSNLIDQGYLMLVTYDEEMLREIFGTYDYKALIHGWMVESGFDVNLIDECYIGIKFKITENFIETPYIVYPVQAEYSFLYQKQGSYYSNEAFIAEHADIIESYNKMLNKMQEYN